MTHPPASCCHHLLANDFPQDKLTTGACEAPRPQAGACGALAGQRTEDNAERQLFALLNARISKNDT